VFDFFRDLADRGLGATLRDRLDWGRMRMNPTDISDVTGATYTYLIDGLAPDSNWTGLFRPGERVRLRFVNASAATLFDVRIPGLPMTVVQKDGQSVQPVETDEFRIAIAETYDVIVEPTEEFAYTLFAESIDRSGYARGTLAPREGLRAPVPERRERPLLTMADMGMDHGGTGGADHGGDEAGGMSGMRHDDRDADGTEHAGHVAGAIAGMGGGAGAGTPRPPGSLPEPTPHGPDGHGPGEAGLPMMTRSRLHEPGIGLGEDGWRVLVYTDLKALDPNPGLRPPDREIELHLTGNMERFMWSIDGIEFSDAEPIRVEYMERIRLTLVNDTMMNHPMHLHGMWMELENGHGEWIPRVHTINVKPAERISLLVTAESPGPWAFHCHVLYHMDVGMFRVFHVSEPADREAQP
ncbi:MAG: copper resistance system multicopper oxidase, partial [Gemmatimonadota bacterium]